MAPRWKERPVHHNHTTQDDKSFYRSNVFANNFSTVRVVFRSSRSCEDHSRINNNPYSNGNTKHQTSSYITRRGTTTSVVHEQCPRIFMGQRCPCLVSVVRVRYNVCR